MGKIGCCYLLHFNEKLKHSQHYLGYTTNLEKRVKEHRSGKGARFPQVMKDFNIDFVVARTWTNATRTLERKLKNQKNGPRLCPVCNKNNLVN